MRPGIAPVCCMFVALALMVSWASTPAAAQSESWFNKDINVSAGGGFSAPVQASASSLNMGWNLDARSGLNIGSHGDADLDFNYSHSGLNSAALAKFGEPGGSVGIWSLQLQPQWHLLAHNSKANAYATAGFGIFHRNLSLTQPAVITSYFCDPFFGCYPVAYPGNVIVASFSTIKPGFNVGGGLEWRVGDSRAKMFAEARYQRMFTNHGADFSYVPVTFGFRW